MFGALIHHDGVAVGSLVLRNCYAHGDGTYTYEGWWEKGDDRIPFKVKHTKEHGALILLSKALHAAVHVGAGE